MKARLLTKQEWHRVRAARGEAMTGQHAHRAKSVPIDPANPTFVRGVGKTYYWCMGNQPDEQIIAVIGRHCPIKAAKAYLTHYAKNDKFTGPRVGQGSNDEHH